VVEPLPQKSFHNLVAKGQIAPHQTEQIMMHFTIVGTIVLCLIATVSGSSLRERDLQELVEADTLGAMVGTSRGGKGKGGKGKGGKGCSFTDPNKAAAFGDIILAQFWEDILHTDCSEDAILKVFNQYFDETIVFTLDGAVIANNLAEFSPIFEPLIEALCIAPDTYLSWVTLNAAIDPVETNVITLNTNRMISSPGGGVCGYGYTYTGRVSGKKCGKAKLTAITGDGTLTLPGLFPCP
jgi:hypothetical protein